jgi:DNA-binding transcriptional regulator YdaS (Cro superfamily)
VDLKTYVASERGAAKKLADSLGISPSYLSQLISGRSAVSPERAVDIERATSLAVTRRDLFPENWQRIWPELQAEQPAAA